MSAVESLQYFVPELWLLGGAFVILTLDFFVNNKNILGYLSFAVLMLAICLSIEFAENSVALFHGFFYLDAYTHFFRLIALGVMAITVLMSLAYPPLKKAYEGEYYVLMLFMAFGLILMGSSRNFLMIFVAIEFVSILSYLLVGYLKEDPRSKEAAMKYLLFGSLASGIMLYGMSLLYGAAGSLDLDTIQRVLSNNTFFSLSFVSCLFILVGLGFKISMAPFHLWAPDVYQGAPTPVTAFLTVGPKALGFAVLIRILTMAFPWLEFQWSRVIMILAMLTMTLGNVTAVTQTSVKRLLAYSSIAQAGYILMGVVVFSEIGITAVLIYLLAYAFTNLGAFTVAIAVSNDTDSDEISGFAGLAKRAPFLAAAMTLFLLSLAGIPPLAGFIGKFYVFSGAVQAGFYTIAIVAALNSAVAAFYYFKIVRQMYLTDGPTETPLEKSFPLSLALYLMLAGTVLLGIAPVPFIDFVLGTLSI